MKYEEQRPNQKKNNPNKPKKKTGGINKGGTIYTHSTTHLPFNYCVVLFVLVLAPCLDVFAASQTNRTISYGLLLPLCSILSRLLVLAPVPCALLLILMCTRVARSIVCFALVFGCSCLSRFLVLVCCLVFLPWLLAMVSCLCLGCYCLCLS